MNQISITVLICGLCASIEALPAVPVNNDDHANIAEPVHVTKFEHPYQISLRLDGSHLCAASLVVVNGQQVVLTTASCLTTGSKDNYTVVAGARDLKKGNDHKQTRQVSRTTIHEDYDSDLLTNNIAILNIESPFELNENVAPIPLPSQEQETTGEVLVSGWDLDPSSELYSTNTQRVLTVLEDDECRILSKYSHYLIHVTPSTLCAGQNGISVFCQYESGGPVIAVNGGYLAGIVVMREGCALPDMGIYTEVSYFVDWINTKIYNPSDMEQNLRPSVRSRLVLHQSSFVKIAR